MPPKRCFTNSLALALRFAAISVLSTSGDLTGSRTLVRFAVAKKGVGVLVDLARVSVATSRRSRVLPRRAEVVSVGVVGAELCTASFGVRTSRPADGML